MGGDRADAAEAAANEQEVNMGRAFGMAIPLEKSLLAYTQGALAKGEPAYVKSGFNSFRQSLADQSRQTTASDFQKIFGGVHAPQGGAALSQIGETSGMGAGREAAAVGQGRFAESQAMFSQTQNLLDVMSGQAASGLGQSVTTAEQQARAISMMPEVDPTFSNIMLALNTAGSVYGGLKSYNSPYGSQFGGTLNMTAPSTLSSGTTNVPVTFG